MYPPISPPKHTLTPCRHTHTHHTQTHIHIHTHTHTMQTHKTHLNTHTMQTHTNTRIHMLGARYTLTHSLSSTSNGDTQTLIKGSSPLHKHTHTKTHTLL